MTLLDSPQLVVRKVESDIVASFAHDATVHGVPALDVRTGAIRSFADEISGDENQESFGKLDTNLDRLRTLLEEIIFDITIQTVSGKPTDESVPSPLYLTDFVFGERAISHNYADKLLRT
jgi:hypothetical protein